VALTALISAYQESDEPGGPLRAVLPLAGRTLVERQAKLAALAGARKILILVERVSPDLLAAIDRLRREGLTIMLARSAEEAAEQVDPADPLLLVADGFIGDESQLRRVAAASPPALLTVPDTAVDDRFERIDAESRWAGLALIDGALLADTASMLRDWDPQSTLSRRARLRLHMLWLGLILLLLATPLDGIADRLARLRLEHGVDHSWWSHLLPAFAGAALLALGLSLARFHGWGAILLAVGIILFLLAQRFEIEDRRPAGLLFLAERKGMTWLILPFALIGMWLAGLFALFAYAAGSFFWAQRAVHTAQPPPEVHGDDQD
jgi:hypothetical protein